MVTTTFLEPGTDATQDFSLFGGTNIGVGDSLTSDTSQSVDGPRSIKSLANTGGHTVDAFTNDGVVADAGSLVSVWVRFSTVSPATTTAFVLIQQAGNGSMIIGVGLNNNGTLHFSGRGTTQKNGSTVLSANTWYRISIGYIITSVSNWSATLYINGVSEATTSNADGNLLLATTSCVGFGINQSSQGGFSSPAAMTIWLDSIYIDNRTDKTDCGEVHVTNKRAFSNGTSNQYTTQIGAGGSGYGSGHAPQVNEQPLSTTNGWSLSNTTKSTEEYNIETQAGGDMNILNATIVDYMGWISAKVDSTANSPVHHIILNNVATAKTMTTSAAIYTAFAGSTTYPAGTGTDIGIDSQYTTTPHVTSLFECGIVFAVKFNGPLLSSRVKPRS